MSAAIVLLASLAAGLSRQLDTNVGRHVIALEFRGASVAFAEHPYRCNLDRASRDILWGTVDGHEDLGEHGAVVYEGVLQRITEQTLCGADVQPTRARHLTVGSAPCRAHLSGAGDVRVRIKVYSQKADQQGAWIVLTPVDSMARVTGTCRSGEMRDMQRAYAERTTIEIQTPPDRLVPGQYAAERDPGATGRWVLLVAPSPSGVPSS